MTMMIPQSVLLIGTTIVLAFLIREISERAHMPAFVGYIVLGFFIRLADSQWSFLSHDINGIYEFLANIGVICLLFDVGLKSKLDGLLRQLRRASVIWIFNVVLSGFIGYIVCYYILEQGIISSLFVSVALTATSVGFPVAIWREAKALNTPNGELMVDVAELDDLSGVIFMAVLFSLALALRGKSFESFVPHVGKIVGIFFIKFVAFALLCFLFSFYAERPLTKFFRGAKNSFGLTLLLVGTGFIISSIAGFLGFSIAIGAFFAGLVFSRDPESIRIQASFISLYEFFIPFFFIGIGLLIDPDTLTMAVGLGMVLVVAAILGKLVGTVAPSVNSLGWTGSIVVGVSMVPRAEIAMVIMERGRSLGDWAVSSQVYAAMVLVTIGTCILSSIALRFLLQKWPQTDASQGTE